MTVEMAKKAPAKPVFGTLNEHLVCTLCKGYLVDATTIVECLHSYCRSCIIQYLQASSFCPRCEVQLDKGDPLRSLKPDKTLQDIVFKLVPNLFHTEMQRRRVYYDGHPQYADQTTPEQRGDCLERFYSPDDSISLSLEYHDRRKSARNPTEQKSLPPKRYLKCPALFTVGLLKKFIRNKFDLPREIVIDIFQRRESLADEYTLLDIAYIYPWKRSEPMQFFYGVRDPRVPESDEEVEREMPSLSAAVSGRATRASRRASSASSLASPMASPRGSPVPTAKRSHVEDKDAEHPPPPARLTAQPPSGTTVQPKPVAAKSATSVTSPTTTGPKITLTISPSRGIVTSTTTVLPSKSPPPAASKPMTPVQAPVKKASTPNTAVNVPAKNGAVAPKPPSFAATVTTKTANGGFVTVKNPIARAANGVALGAKTPVASPQTTAPTSPKVTPILPKPSQSPQGPQGLQGPQSGPKGKRLTNGLPTLAPKTATPSPQPASKPPAPPVAAGASKVPDATSKKTVTLTSVKPGMTPVPTIASPALKMAEEEKNKVETAKAILQLSMGFKHNQQTRSNTPTDSTLHNRIDKIVKDLHDDESNDGTLVIKSEPASPATSSSPRDSPIPSPGPELTKGKPSAPPSEVPAAPTLPNVNGLTITPIESSKRKSTSSPSIEEKRPRLEAAKSPANEALPSPAPLKQAKVDKIAESIKLKQEMMLRQKEGQKPATPHLQPSGQVKPVGGQLQVAKPALNCTKPSPPVTKQPLSSPTTLKSFPPAQMKPVAPKPLAPKPLAPKPVALKPVAPKPVAPKPVLTPVTVTQGKPPTQHKKPTASTTVATPGQPSPTTSAKASTQFTPTAKPTTNSQQAKLTSAGQAGQVPAQQQQGKQATLPSAPQQQQPRPTTPQQAKTAPQSKPSSVQQAAQAAQAKPTPPQGKPAVTKQDSQVKPALTPPAKPASPKQQCKSPESPVKNKKPIPDLQRLQRPLSTLSGTTVNGCVSLAEVKEQLAKKGQYSPPPAQQPLQPNRTPPRLLDISQQQRKSAPPVPNGTNRDGFGALDLSSASPRASDHGGSWTPPPSFAQALVKRHMLGPQGMPLRPPPSSLSSLSSSSPSPPADSPELFLDPAVLTQHAQQQALLQHLQLQSLLQAQAQAQAAHAQAGLKKAIEDWAASDRIGVKTTAKRK